jgi:hypothetical protein
VQATTPRNYRSVGPQSSDDGWQKLPVYEPTTAGMRAPPKQAIQPVRAALQGAIENARQERYVPGCVPAHTTTHLSGRRASSARRKARSRSGPTGPGVSPATTPLHEAHAVRRHPRLLLVVHRQRSPHECLGHAGPTFQLRRREFPAWLLLKTGNQTCCVFRAECHLSPPPSLNSRLHCWPPHQAFGTVSLRPRATVRPSARAAGSPAAAP